MALSGCYIIGIEEMQYCKWMLEMEQETGFAERKSELACSHVMTYFSQEAEAEDGRGAIMSQKQTDEAHQPLCSLMYTVALLRWNEKNLILS